MPAKSKKAWHLRCNRICRFGHFLLFGLLLAFAGLARPDVEAAVAIEWELPGAPNAFAFPEAVVENVMRAEVTLGPVTFQGAAIVAAPDEKAANVIQALPAYRAMGEAEMELHPVPAPARTIIVKAAPLP